jgi:hypothetical protein
MEGYISLPRVISSLHGIFLKGTHNPGGVKAYREPVHIIERHSRRRPCSFVSILLEPRVYIEMTSVRGHVLEFRWV